MQAAIQFCWLAVALIFISVGLWLIAPAAMFVGVGTIILAGVIAVRLAKAGDKHVRRDS